ncbi:MAG: fibronectin type III domain-containing protein [Candidatus Gracilibacteria bacterium]
MKKLFSLFAGLVLALNLASTVFAVAPDVTKPSDVENVKAVAGDEMVTLSWDVATDDVGVEGYYVYNGLETVNEEDEEYTFAPQDVGDVVSAEASGLENDTTYYFAVTAYDAAGNESEKFSLEVSATPEAGLGEEEDTLAPTVVAAEAVSKIEVDVEFSEKVELPEDNPEQAFSIEAEETLEFLDVLDAVVLEDSKVDEGKEGKVVRLTTDKQTKAVSYILTATIDVTDLAGNPIVSGTSDTASFVGSDKASEAADEEGPKVDSVEFTDYTHLLVNFNETVVLGLITTDHFEVKLKGSATAEPLEVSGVVLGTNTKNKQLKASVILTLEDEMEAGKTYVVKVTNITDEALNKIQAAHNSDEVVASGEGVEGEGEGEGEVEEVLKDPAKLLAEALSEVVDEEEVWKVLLKWTLPGENISVAQKIYVSANGTAYGTGAPLGVSDNKYTYADDLKAGKNYWFKLTQVDAAGKESKGVVAKVKLSATGPGVIGLVLVSLGLGRLASRRKK